MDDPATLIDTLAQRKRGFAAPVMDCVRHLLQSYHWLFLGFSGLDLEAERNYLALEQEAERAVGFTWFVHEKTEPKPAVVRLKNIYGEHGSLVYSSLPKWLLDFADSLTTEPRACNRKINAYWKVRELRKFNGFRQYGHLHRWPCVRSRLDCSRFKTAGLKDCYCQQSSFVINWRASDVAQ